jgi:hypothetical protein
MKLRMTVLAVLAITLAILPLVVVPSALAEATQVRTPITFTLSGCTSLPAGLTVYGSGESLLVITSRVDKQGLTHIERNNLVTGTAIDSNGASYVFNYFGHTSLVVPPGGFPFQITIGTDHFNLVGDGQANQLQVHFVARATFYAPPTPPTIEFINVHGSPFSCDPI